MLIICTNNILEEKLFQIFKNKIDCASETIQNGDPDGQGGTPRPQHRDLRDDESGRKEIRRQTEAAGQPEAALQGPML